MNKIDLSTTAHYAKKDISRILYRVRRRSKTIDNLSKKLIARAKYPQGINHEKTTTPFTAIIQY